jgi:hypothetical protein
MMKEMECNFVDPDKVEIRLTLFGYIDELKTYKNDSTIYQESKIYDYTFKDGYLEIPELRVNTRLTENQDGDYQTNTNETFYKQSIVDILNTQDAKNRIIKASPMTNITSMYLDMLNYSANGRYKVFSRDGKLVFQGSKDSKDSGLSKPDTAKMVSQNTTDSVDNPNTHKAFKPYKVVLPDPPIDIIETGKNKIEFGEKDNGGTQIGIIEKIDEDNNLIVCSKNNNKYVSENLSVGELSFPDPAQMSQSDYSDFKKIVVPGRRIEFEDMSNGTQELRHLTLTYIKALPSATLKIKNQITIKEDF